MKFALIINMLCFARIWCKTICLRNHMKGVRWACVIQGPAFSVYDAGIPVCLSQRIIFPDHHSTPRAWKEKVMNQQRAGSTRIVLLAVFLSLFFFANFASAGWKIWAGPKSTRKQRGEGHGWAHKQTGRQNRKAGFYVFFSLATIVGMRTTWKTRNNLMNSGESKISSIKFIGQKSTSRKEGTVCWFLWVPGDTNRRCLPLCQNYWKRWFSTRNVMNSGRFWS